jgi:long-chain acyl-CoA synthetase
MSVETIPQLFYSAVREHNRPDMFMYKGDDGKYIDVSSDEMLRRVRAIRLALDGYGISKGGKVAILSENCLEWAISDLAILSTGAADVPIYPTLLEDTVEYILKDCEPSVIFVSNANQAQKIHNIRGNLPFLKYVISFEHVDLPDIKTFDEMLELGNNLADKHPQEPTDDIGPAEKDDLCSIIYTSGTTGNPKGVMLSHWNFVCNVLMVDAEVDFHTMDKGLSFLPLSHVLERMGGFYTLMYEGIGIAYAESVETVAADMEIVKPSIMVSVPRLYEKIFDKVNAKAMAGSPVKRNIFLWANAKGKEWGEKTRNGEQISWWLGFQYKIADKLVFSKLREKTGGKLQLFISGGAPLAPHIHEFFYAAGLIVLEGYGLTETSPVVSCNSLNNLRIGSIGKVMQDTEIKIADDGEIMIKGPQVMLGYYNNEEATKEAISEDGWFASGDIGEFDDDDFLYITDRKKDIIVTAGGKNIAPQPIENLFKKNKFIAQLVVIGDTKPYLVSLIVPNFENLETWATGKGLSWNNHTELVGLPEVIDKFQRGVDRHNSHMPSFNTVKKFSLMTEEFTLENDELTPTLKVKRRVIQKKYGELIDALYK